MTAEPILRTVTRSGDAPTTPVLHLGRFEELKTRLPGHGVPWLARLREASVRQFSALGFPTMKDEAWHYTNLRDLAEAGLPPSPGVLGLAADLPASCSGARLVFVGGRYRGDLSDLARVPDEVMVEPLADVLERNPDAIEPYLRDDRVRDGIEALNGAFMADGVVIRIPRGVRLENPLHLVVTATPGRAAHLRMLVIAERESAATAIEHYLGRGAETSWTNVVTRCAIGPGAALRHVKIQDEGAAAFHTSTVAATIEAGATFESFVLAKGGRLARHEVEASLDGEGASCALHGITLARGHQHIDNTTVIEHRAPGCTSDELYRGVIDDEARAVFQGRIVVRPGAQKTDAHQLNENLLLSERAAVDTKPELEIHADDVKCGHGATAGALDEQALFYLQARGIGRRRATGMLIEAFVADLLDRAKGDDVVRLLHEAVGGWLPQPRVDGAAA